MHWFIFLVVTADCGNVQRLKVPNPVVVRLGAGFLAVCSCGLSGSLAKHISDIESQT